MSVRAAVCVFALAVSANCAAVSKLTGVDRSIEDVGKTAEAAADVVNKITDLVKDLTQVSHDAAHRLR